MPRRYKQQLKETKVMNEYFSNGLADAIRDSLKSLFSETELPDNPYYYLAAALSAYVDQNPLWAEPDVDIILRLDQDGGLDVLDAVSKLCKLAAAGSVLGLPHVLRAVSKEGANVVYDVLTNSLPDSVFPGCTPFSAKAGYTVQLLSSVQGSTVLWHPQWLEFPELAWRCDVVIKGPRLDDALGLLAELLTSDLQELEAVPVYFVEGLRFVDPLGKPSAGNKQTQAKHAGPSATAAAGSTAGHLSSGPLWRLSDMLGRPDEFRRVLSREVVSGKQVVMFGVVMLEAPVDTGNLQRYHARFESFTKVWRFHFVETADTTTSALPAALARSHSTVSSSKRGVSHYGSLPYDALYEGYFLEAAAAKAYLALYQASHNAPPYSKELLRLNTNRLADKIEEDVVGGSTLEAFRRLLLLVLLQDDRILQQGPLQPSALRSVEELLLSHPPQTENDMMLSTVVNLERMLNSGAAEIQAIVRELEALMLVVEQWPHRREACLAQATAAAGVLGAPEAVAVSSESRRASGTPAAAGSGTSLRAAVGSDTSHAAATLAWLADHNNMEARVIEQLVSLKPRVAASTGGGILSGISVILGRLLSQLPDSVPATAQECKAALAAARAPMANLHQMLAAAALSLADALLDRCRDVMWVMQRFGIRQVDSVVARAALARDEADLPPEWVLDVDAVTDMQVRAGAVAERVGTEGVMLQYAVDTKLDLCLSSIYEAVTKPPLPLNPYPRLLHILRAHAAKLDLFQEDMADVREQLLNQLVLLDPPSFMYAAQPPAASSRRRKLAGAAVMRSAGAVGHDDDDSTTVFGSYAAVTLCDCRSLQGLSSSLGPLLLERQWQQGSYNADVLVALTGDAALSGALALSKAEELPINSNSNSSSSRPGGQGPGPSWSAYEHPRFYCVELEEHHQVEGPELLKASNLFAKGVIDYLLELHHKSQHIVQHVAVGPLTFELPELLQTAGQEELTSALVAALSRLTVLQPNTYADACVAVVHLLVVVREGLYVKLLRRMHFNFQQQGLPRNTVNTAATAAHRHLGVAGSRQPGQGDETSAAGAAGNRPAGSVPRNFTGTSAVGSTGRSGSWQQLRDAETELLEPHWDAGVYSRVFLSEASAQAWYAWNSLRGDPAQPFHYQHLLVRLQQQVPNLEAQGLLLDVQKLLLTAAVATQDATTICTGSRCMQSAAQELRCLQDMGACLLFLLAEDLPQAHATKVDAERVRRLFLLYCNRVRRALTSPKYSYFSGFAAAAPGLVAELREHVLSSGKLDAARTSILQQLNIWTLACELSVAASIHDSLGSSVQDVLRNLLHMS